MPVLDQDYEVVAVDALTAHPGNPRRGDLLLLSESIASTGFYGAVVAQRSTGHVLAGNHRLLAAKEQGIKELPVIWVDVDDDRARRILLMDNRANDVAGYDDEALAQLLSELGESTGGLVGTGYSEEDLLALLSPGDVKADTDEDTDDVVDEEGGDPAAEEEHAKSDGSLLELADVSVAEPTHVVETGEVWNLGHHVLVVGKVHTSWSQWVEHLTPGCLFIPYPGAYVALTTKASTTPLVMVQPDPYLAGHVLDKYAAVHGEASVSRA